MNALACVITLAVALMAQPAGDEPAVIGVLATRPEAPDSDGWQFVRGARLAIESARSTVHLQVEDCGGTTTGVDDAVARLAERAVSAVIGPAEPSLVAHARAACAARKIPFFGPASPHPDDEHEVDRLLETARLYAAWRLAVLHDGSQASKSFLRQLRARLPHPFDIMFDASLSTSPRSLKKKFDQAQPQLLVLHADPAKVAQFLQGERGGFPWLVVLTSRSYGDALRSVHREGTVHWMVQLNASPAVLAPVNTQWLSAFRNRFGEPRYGAAEGFESAAILCTALAGESALDSEMDSGMVVQGPRGNLTFDANTSGFRLATSQLALWKLSHGSPAPYSPSPIPIEWYGKGTDDAKRPDANVGEPFNSWRTADFVLEEQTQWVLCTYGEQEESTIDEDLRILGLSTRGQAPLLDHLIKEELMARVLAITSSKFLRADDGASVPGKSLRISFATHLPEKAKKGKAWLAVFAGDDEFAGGRAFGSRAEIYATFMRRTIFELHALDPPVSADDLPYLDGSYRFGTDRTRDMRAELIRALINGYAGSMALTAAHEIGHCAGLDHTTEQPYAIMNVEEGAGLDYRDGRFTDKHLELMRKRFGVSGE